MSTPRPVARMASASACRRSSPAWWPWVSLTALRSSRSRRTSASGTPVRADALQLASEVLVEGAMVAQARERIGDRHLGQALDLGGDGRVEAAPVAHDDGAEERDQEQREENRDAMVRLARTSSPRNAALWREGRGARGRRLAVDDVREDAEDGVDGRVVEPQDALLVVLVDRVEQRLAGAVVVGLQAQEPCDGGAAGRRAVELEDVVEVGASAAARPGGGRRRPRSCPRSGTGARRTSARPPSGARPDRWRSGGWRGRRWRT